MPMSKIKLPDTVSSPQDVAALIQEVKLYARWASHTLIKQRAGVQNVKSAQNVQAGQTEQATPANDTATAPADTPTLTPAAKILLASWAAQVNAGTNGGQALTSANLDELVLELQDIIDMAPTITITLAAPASAGIKKSLVTWCRANIAPDALVSFGFNATLLGGMVVRFGSHLYDWSFRRQILQNRAKIPEVLRRV
jgi:hypothetical protein